MNHDRQVKRLMALRYPIPWLLTLLSAVAFAFLIGLTVTAVGASLLSIYCGMVKR